MEKSAKDLLEQNHTFPGPYRFKIIGENSPAFTEAVTQVAPALTGSAWGSIDQRLSAAGNHLALTLLLNVQDADTVLKIYDALRAVPGVRMVL